MTPYQLAEEIVHEVDVEHLHWRSLPQVIYDAVMKHLADYDPVSEIMREHGSGTELNYYDAETTGDAEEFELVSDRGAYVGRTAIEACQRAIEAQEKTT